ncbi:MAG: HlyD family efflux transporter periplasmic adaptor subunit [Candidatus Acidiferrales bacterium]
MEPSIYARARTATEPAAAPAEITPRPNLSIAEKPRRAPHRNKFFAAILAILVIAAILFVIFRNHQTAASAVAGAETAPAFTENFVSVLRLAGSTEALRSRPIVAPQLAGSQLNSMVVTHLVPAGTFVRKGDLLVEFDRQAQIKDALDKKATYQDLVDQVVEKQAAEGAARAKDEDDLQQARDALQKAQLEMGKNEILSRIDVEKNQEALAEAQETLKQLQHTFDLKRQAAAADIRTVVIQRDRARATMLYAESNAGKMSIRSPMDGVVVLNTIWNGSRIAPVQEGDEVRPGVPFMKVVDPSAMEVRVQVNQDDLLKLHLGQHAQISLDAYPGMTFSGTLEELSPLGQASDQSDTLRSFTALFSIQGANSKLMPDLSASVDLQLANVKDALVVPAEGVEHEAGRDYVWLKTGGAFIRRAVTAGPSNGLETVIEAGLKPHDVVRLTPQLGQGSS